MIQSRCRLAARQWQCSTTTIFGIANRSASKITLDPGELRRPLPSLAPYELRGAWHGTTLLLHVQYQVAKKYGYSTVQTPVAVTFHKNGYSAYQAACARV
jgi:hypothetical protein